MMIGSLGKSTATSSTAMGSPYLLLFAALVEQAQGLVAVDVVVGLHELVGRVDLDAVELEHVEGVGDLALGVLAQPRMHAAEGDDPVRVLVAVGRAVVVDAGTEAHQVLGRVVDQRDPGDVLLVEEADELAGLLDEALDVLQVRAPAAHDLGDFGLELLPGLDVDVGVHDPEVSDLHQSMFRGVPSLQS
jgi:hypothetical protein